MTCRAQVSKEYKETACPTVACEGDNNQSDSDPSPRRRSCPVTDGRAEHVGDGHHLSPSLGSAHPGRAAAHRSYYSLPLTACLHVTLRLTLTKAAAYCLSEQWGNDMVIVGARSAVESFHLRSRAHTNVYPCHYKGPRSNINPKDMPHKFCICLKRWGKSSLAKWLYLPFSSILPMPKAGINSSAHHPSFLASHWQ